MSVYRVAAEREPEPKRSWWCRIGLHRWRLVLARPYLEHHYVCDRDGCGETRWMWML